MLMVGEGTHFPRRTSDHRRRLARHFGRKQGRTAVAAVHRTATSNIGSRLNPSSLGKRKPKKVPASINRPLSAGVLGSSREAFAIVERVARHRIERKSHVRVVPKYGDSADEHTHNQPSGAWDLLHAQSNRILAKSRFFRKISLFLRGAPYSSKATSSSVLISSMGTRC